MATFMENPHFPLSCCCFLLLENCLVTGYMLYATVKARSFFCLQVRETGVRFTLYFLSLSTGSESPRQSWHLLFILAQRSVVTEARERSQWQWMCPALTKQAEKPRTSGQEADSSAGIQGIFPLSLCHLFLKWGNRGAASDLVPLFFPCLLWLPLNSQKWTGAQGVPTNLKWKGQDNIFPPLN